MSVWEEQSDQTDQRRQRWSASQDFNCIECLRNATNEEEVKAAYIREFCLPVKTQERHDLLVDQVLFEFKYSVKLRNIDIAAKVAAQAIYYVNRLFRKGRITEIQYIVIADKDEARIFNIKEFQLFYESEDYAWNKFRPSSPDPRLIEAIKSSRLLEANRVYEMTSESDFQLFSSKLYRILSPPHCAENLVKARTKKRIDRKILAAIVGLILVVSSSVILANQNLLNVLNRSNPTHRK